MTMRPKIYVAPREAPLDSEEWSAWNNTPYYITPWSFGEAPVIAVHENLKWLDDLSSWLSRSQTEE